LNLARKFTYLTAVLLFLSTISSAQEPTIRRNQPSAIGDRVKNLGNIRSSGTGDSLKHRDRNEDSLTIYYRFLDTARRYKLDSSVNDFTTRFPIPATNIHLGNLGTASRSILFSPKLDPGFDPGFHAFDVYKWKMENVRFFNSTRPYSELNYLLGSKTEQIIEVMHTQNIKPNWNAAFQYRTANSPGFFKNQKTSDNNYLFSSWYEANSKQYNNFFVILANHLQSEENGGIQADQDYLHNTVTYKNRFDIPVTLGGDEPFSTNFFTTKIFTGNRYREFNALMRQQYDLGKKDSLVTDSTIIPLFYPRLRFEHTLQYKVGKYQFFDLPHPLTTSFYFPDSAYYKNNYGITINNGYNFPDTSGDSLQLTDRWKIFSNDFSVYTFPDPKNLLQFFKVGATVQNLRGEFTGDTSKFFNVIMHGEYRNKTRNQKWDMELAGNLYSAGFNSGDYNVYAKLKRFIGKKNLGYTEVGFENVNRTPSFLFDTRSSFYLDATQSFKKENTTHIFASVFHTGLNMKLTGDLFLVSNYTYFSDFYKLRQFEPLFNFLRISAQKIFRLGKYFNWYADVYLQQKTGSSPLHVPLIFTRNRIAYEGNLGFRRLTLSTGFEVKYHSPYKADNYSPVLGQFFYQDSVTISNKPEVSAFIHMRIRGFKAFIRAENLNTMQVTEQGGFGFTNNNLAAPGYPYPGLQIRLGIWWNFVN
jgi:hypothetical protein